MASTNALASSSSTTQTQEVRPQAGPIPSKRGEIGFVEGVHEQVQEPSQTIDQAPLPARHPADIRVPTPFQDPANEAPSPSGTFRAPSVSSSITDVGKHTFLRRKRLPIFMGIQFTTLVLLGVQLALFTGTVIGWVFAAIALSGNSSSNVPPPPPGPGPAINGPANNGSPPQQGDSSASHIFIHVAFAILALGQLVLIERRIFRVRAERYVFKHPGEMLPTSLQRGQSVDAAMPVAPWSRPPLPTYAAALASSGVGTGDVEDIDIAQPPPPAYGQTRGSTLILAGFLRNSLRAQAREYDHYRASTMSVRNGNDRPISFVSQDEEWEVRRDADRARRIEEALATLENSREPTQRE
ncbi:hypothetical protein V8E52_002855 [Russula decolorans]|jgi:hypothetical protein